MIIIKKITIHLILSGLVVLVAYLLVNEYILSSTTTQEAITEQKFLKESAESLKNEAKTSPVSIVQKKLIKEDALKESDIPPALSKTTQIMEIHQQRKNDPTVTLKISDFSPQEQILQKKWLTDYNENGYIQTSEVSFDYIKSQNELVELVVPDPSIISIPLLQVSATKLSEYEYLGSVLNTEEEPSSLNSEITRAYRGNDGQEVFLLEKSVKNSKAILIDEFVTDNISGYPASRMTFCTEDHRCMSKITLITKDKLYEVSTYGNQNTTKDRLIEIISSFDLPKLEVQ